MIHKFEKFNDYTHELDQLEDIFSNIDFDLNVKRIKSDIQYEGIVKKDIPKFIIHIEFSGKNKLDSTFQEIDKKVIASESFGYSMSHARVCFIEKSYNFEEVEDCYGFDDPTSWIINEIRKNHYFETIHEFNRTSTIKYITIYFNPIK